jgi:hypothetical protein
MEVNGQLHAPIEDIQRKNMTTALKTIPQQAFQNYFQL